MCKFFYVREDNAGAVRPNRLCFWPTRAVSNCVSGLSRVNCQTTSLPTLAAARRDSCAPMLTAGVPSTRLGHFLGHWDVENNHKVGVSSCGSMGVRRFAWQSNYILWASKQAQRKIQLLSERFPSVNKTWPPTPGQQFLERMVESQQETQTPHGTWNHLI